eukprot:480085-Pelagomonas_calceolata.AAC.1
MDQLALVICKKLGAGKGIRISKTHINAAQLILVICKRSDLPDVQEQAAVLQNARSQSIQLSASSSPTGKSGAGNGTEVKSKQQHFKIQETDQCSPAFPFCHLQKVSQQLRALTHRPVCANAWSTSVRLLIPSASAGAPQSKVAAMQGAHARHKGQKAAPVHRAIVALSHLHSMSYTLALVAIFPPCTTLAAAHPTHAALHSLTAGGGGGGGGAAAAPYPPAHPVALKTPAAMPAAAAGGGGAASSAPPAVCSATPHCLNPHPYDTPHAHGIPHAHEGIPHGILPVHGTPHGTLSPPPFLHAHLILSSLCHPAGAHT